MADRHAVEHVVVADEDADWRTLVSGLVVAGGAAVVAEAGDLDETVRVCREHRPDVLIIDLDMQDGDIQSGLWEVSHRSPATIIIGLFDPLTPATHGDAGQAGTRVSLAGISKVVRKSLAAQTLMRNLNGSLSAWPGGTDPDVASPALGVGTTPRPSPT